jgi:hypothetical protein
MLEKIPEATRNTNIELEDLALIVAKEIRTANDITFEQRKELLALVRKWSEYVKNNGVDQSDVLSVRYHLLEFSKNNFAHKRDELEKDVKLQSVPIDGLELPDGSSFKDYINRNFEEGDIFNDEHTAIYGGIARLALKLHASQKDPSYDARLIDSELPIHDIDVVVDDKNVGNKYKSGIAGTRVVRDLKEYIQTYHQIVECTINQALVYKGDLLFTEDALQDNTTGELHFIERDETLFNPDSVVLEDGKVFVTGKGFYRALAYLLRHKAHKLSLYQDNLDFLKKNKYTWASPLPKILFLKNPETRNRAINEWYSLAKSLGVTSSSNPTEFLEEIISENPNIVNYNFKTEENNAEEIRWIINQFLRSGIRSVIPDTYPKGMRDEVVTIDMRELDVESHDLKEFYEKVNSTFKNANFNIV